ENCEQRYSGVLFGMQSQFIVDSLHYVSAGVVSFARGLNDTPKMVALLLAGSVFGLESSMIFVSLLIAVGGIINAGKVADTMGKKITTLSHGQGFTANLCTGAIVIVSSLFGMPVSTTHVSCGSLFGIGLITRQGNARIIINIFLSWVLTLPVAAVISGMIFLISNK
ncbi:MAG: inorganic phosphate transporter, partial [Planctomycetes bacterium]|nr:inorganic phosphate transporter [Planctomycetota bacterium]